MGTHVLQQSLIILHDMTYWPMEAKALRICFQGSFFRNNFQSMRIQDHDGNFICLSWL